MLRFAIICNLYLSGRATCRSAPWLYTYLFLPRDALQCKARSCDRMSSVCLIVRPSVTLVNCDYIGWNSSKIISRLVSLGCSLSADPNIKGLLQGEHQEIFAQSDPSACWFERRRHSIANCVRMVTDSATVTPYLRNRSSDPLHVWF